MHSRLRLLNNYKHCYAIFSRRIHATYNIVLTANNKKHLKFAKTEKSPNILYDFYEQLSRPSLFISRFNKTFVLLACCVVKFPFANMNNFCKTASHNKLQPP